MNFKCYFYKLFSSPFLDKNANYSNKNANYTKG
jgi:hypothetical protein